MWIKSKIFLLILILIAVFTSSQSAKADQWVSYVSANFSGSAYLNSGKNLQFDVTPLVNMSDTWRYLNWAWTDLDGLQAGAAQVGIDVYSGRTQHNFVFSVENATDQQIISGVTNSVTCDKRNPYDFKGKTYFQAVCWTPYVLSPGHTFRLKVYNNSKLGPTWFNASFEDLTTGAKMEIGSINAGDKNLSAPLKYVQYGMGDLGSNLDCSAVGINDTVISSVASGGVSLTSIASQSKGSCINVVIVPNKYPLGGYVVKFGGTNPASRDLEVGALLNKSQPGQFGVDLQGTQSGSYYADFIRPGTGGSRNEILCSAGSVITQIQVSRRSNLPFLQGFKFGCADLSESGQISSLKDVREVVNVETQPEDFNVFNCPTGEAAVAINAHSASYIRDLGLTCAKPSPFKISTNLFAGVGPSFSLNQTSSCMNPNSTPSFITGVNIFAMAGLDAIRAICTPKTFSLTPTPTPTPKPVTKPATPSFSLINITGNKLNVSVNLGNAGASRPDSVYLVAPKLGILDSNKLFGDVSGSKASWSIDFDKLLSGAAIPLKVVGVKNGVESEPLEQDFNAPAAVEKLLTNKSAPLPPKNVKSRIVGTSAIISAEATVKAGALATSAYFVSSSFGSPSGNSIIGEVIGAKVLFEIPLRTSMAGKTFPFTIFLANEAGKSLPVQSKFSIPAAPKIPSGTIKLPTQTKAPKTVLCLKGSQTRTFAANSCPPGWKSA
jgi:hypothetical protein